MEELMYRPRPYIKIQVYNFVIVSINGTIKLLKGTGYSVLVACKI
jgi:hypothetical protein